MDQVSDSRIVEFAETPARKQLWRLLLLVALVLQLTWMLNVYTLWKEPNSASRVYLSLAIVEHGTFQIDQCIAAYGDLLDKAKYQDHYYSDKAPGTSFLFLPVAWITAAITKAGPAVDGQPPGIDMPTLFYTLRVLCISIPTIAFWWLTLPWFRLWTGRDDRAIAVVAAGALGTNFMIYATQLFAHVPAAWFLFLAFLSVRRCWATTSATGANSQVRWTAGFFGGLLSGAAFLNDYVVMLAVAALGIATALPARRWQQALWFGLGLAPALVVWMAYNWICFGHPLKTGFIYHAAPQYGETYQAGFLGIQAIDPAAVLGMLFSPARGMCFLSPVLVLAPFGWWKQVRAGQFRGDALCAAALCVALFVFAMTTVDWRGGWGIGARYLVPAVPFLLVGVAGAVRLATAEDAVSIVFGGLALVGVVLTALAAMTVPLFPQDFENPLYSLVAPLVRQGYLGPHLATGSLGIVAGAFPFIFGGLITCFLVLSSGPATNVVRRLGCVAASLGLAGLLMVAQAALPEPPAEQLARDITRAEVLCRLEYLDVATSEILGLSPNPTPAPTGGAHGDDR